MSEADAPRRSGGASAVTGLARAAARGAAAFLVAAAAAELLALGAWLALGRPFGLRLPAKAGWLYLLSFERVGIDIRAPAFAYIAGVSALRVHVAALAGTALAIVLLFRAGRRSGGRRTEERLARSAAVALGYGVPISVGATLVHLRFPDAGISVVPATAEAWILPTVVALAPAVAGGFWPAPPNLDGRGAVLGSAAGAVRMFCLAMVLSVVGLLVVAGLRPDGAGSYWRAVTSGGTGRAVAILANQALLLPNQAVDLLAPAMGVCDVATGDAGRTELLCFARQPLARIVDRSGELGDGRTPSDESMPAAFVVLVVAPLAATMVAGWAVGAGRSRRLAWRTGAAAGVGFALLFGVAVWAATISTEAVGGSPSSRGTATDFATTSIGPELVPATVAALAWGVVGGTVGALLAPRDRRG